MKQRVSFGVGPGDGWLSPGMWEGRARAQVHKRQRERGVRKLGTLRGEGCPRGEGGGLGRCSRAGDARPGPRPAGSRALRPRLPFPPRPGVRRRKVPGRRLPAQPPGCPASRSAPTSGASPVAPTLVPSPAPEPLCRGRPQNRRRLAPRPRGRSGPRGCASCGRRERAQQGPPRRPRRALSGWEDRGEAPRRPPTAVPPRPDRIGLQRRPVPPPATWHWMLKKGRLSSPLGAGLPAEGRGRSQAQAEVPPRCASRSTRPRTLTGRAGRGGDSAPQGLPGRNPRQLRLLHLPHGANRPHRVGKMITEKMDGRTL